MPVMAPLPTTPVMPWPCVEANSFCQIRSIRNGSSPTTSGVRSVGLIQSNEQLTRTADAGASLPCAACLTCYA